MRNRQRASSRSSTRRKRMNGKAVFPALFLRECRRYGISQSVQQTQTCTPLIGTNIRSASGKPAMPIHLPELPVTAVLPEIGQALSEHGRAVLSAPPGAGKTTLVPLFLLDVPWRGDGRRRSCSAATAGGTGGGSAHGGYPGGIGRRNRRLPHAPPRQPHFGTDPHRSGHRGRLCIRMILDDPNLPASPPFFDHRRTAARCGFRSGAGARRAFGAPRRPAPPGDVGDGWISNGLPACSTIRLSSKAWAAAFRWRSATRNGRRANRSGRR